MKKWLPIIITVILAIIVGAISAAVGGFIGFLIAGVAAFFALKRPVTALLSKWTGGAIGESDSPQIGRRRAWA